jgi:hypothetical protein
MIWTVRRRRGPAGGPGRVRPGLFAPPGPGWPRPGESRQEFFQCPGHGTVHAVPSGAGITGTRDDHRNLNDHDTIIVSGLPVGASDVAGRARVMPTISQCWRRPGNNHSLEHFAPSWHDGPSRRAYFGARRSPQPQSKKKLDFVHIGDSVQRPKQPYRTNLPNFKTRVKLHLLWAGTICREPAVFVNCWNCSDCLHEFLVFGLVV